MPRFFEPHIRVAAVVVCALDRRGTAQQRCGDGPRTLVDSALRMMRGSAPEEIADRPDACVEPRRAML